jgi:hypothetical protein
VEGRERRELADEVLRHTWACLIEDFQRRIRVGEIYLSGVQVAPERQETIGPIPGVWAVDLEFDFFRDVVTIGMTRRYVAVTASRSAPVSAPQAEPLAAPKVTCTPDIVPELDDETILALLEENAKRVIADPTAKLHPPGRLSVMPLIQGKMRHRAAHGELLSGIGAESKWLHKWASSRISLHSVPSAPTVERVLGKEYEVLQARSKPDIQKSNR